MIDDQSIYETFPKGGAIKLCDLNQITHIDHSNANRIVVTFNTQSAKSKKLILNKTMITPELRAFFESQAIAA